MESRILRNLLMFLICSCLFAVSAFAKDNKTDPVTENSQFNIYKIGQGDLLKVVVWKEESLSVDSTMVRLDGKITLPLVNDVQAEGLSTMDLKKSIEEKLSQFVESPLVTVILLDPLSQKYYILGEVQSIGEYPIIKKMTVMQAFAVAGGFTEWASKKEIILFRDVNGEQKVMRLNYKNVIKGKRSQDNIVIKADDIIIVP